MKLSQASSLVVGVTLPLIFNAANTLTGLAEAGFDLVEFINLFQRYTRIFHIEIKMAVGRHNQIAFISLFAHRAEVVGNPILTDNAFIKAVVNAVIPRDGGFAVFFDNFFASRANRKNWYKPCNFAPKMDESGDFWRSVTTEMAVRHNKCELAPPAAFQSVLAVAAAVMQRGIPQKKKSLTGKSGKAQPVPPTGFLPYG